jgi:glycerol-3-phosphate acyltransferase PlsY
LAVATGGFALCLAATRYVSLGSVVAAIAFGITQIVVAWQTPGAEFAPLLAFSIVLPGLVIWRHRGNLVRVWHGQEPKMGRKKKEVASG